MKHKSAILFWIDFSLVVLMGSLVTTGIILRWVLPPGSGGGAGRGAGRLGQGGGARQLMDLSRHEWGDVHLWIALTLLSLLLLHLALHWGWIKTCTPRYLLNRKTRPSCPSEPQAQTRSA
jgi:hypothetical protein